jgi:hypothetical protein
MEVIRQLTIRATAQGVEQAEAGLRRLADAQTKVGEAAGGASVEVSRAERSIQSAGSQFDRLLRSIDPVTRAMAQYEAGIRTVARAEAAGKTTADEATRARQILLDKLNAVTNAARQNADAMDEAAAATARANAAAASSRLNLGGMTLGGAGAAAGFGRLGAFSAVQAEATGAAKAVGLANHEVVQMQAQLSDLAVQLVSGGSPFMAIMQQGSQLSPILGAQGGIQGAVAAISAGFMSMLTPVNMAIVGFGALAAAASYLFATWGSGSSAVEDDLKAHADLIDRLTDRYGKAAEAARRYIREAEGITRFRAGASQDRLRLDLQNEVSSFLTPLSQGTTRIRFGDAFNEVAPLIDDLRAGRIEVDAFQESLIRLAAVDPANEALRRLAAELLAGSDAAADIKRQIEAMSATLSATTPEALAAARAAERYSDAMKIIAEATPDARSEIEKIQDAYEGAMRAASGASDRVRAFNAAMEATRQALAKDAPIPPEKPNLLDFDPNEGQTRSLRSIEAAAAALQVEQDALRMGAAAAAAYRKEHELLASIKAQGREATEAEVAAIRELAAAYGQQAAAVEQRRSVEQQSKAYLDVVTSAKQRLEQMQLEQQMLGMSADAVARLRIEQELLNKATSAGVMLSPQQRQELSGLAAQMAEAEVQTKAMKEASDLLGQGLEAAFSGSSDAIKRFLLDLAKAALQALLFGQGPLANLMAVVTRGATAGASSATGAATPASAAAAAVQAAVALPTARPIATAAAAVANDNGANLLPFLGAGKAASHITGLSDPFEDALSRMFADAPASVRSAVTINSGFRSVERQTELFNAAVAKYGSVAAARRWVAPPGRSQHNFGNAADLGFQSGEAREWFHANAGRYGLEFPMGHEPWHIQGTKGLGDGGAADAVQRLAEASDKASSGLGTFGKSIDEVITGTSLTGGQGAGAVAGLATGAVGAPPAAQAAQNVQQGFVDQLSQGLTRIVQGVGQIAEGFLGSFGSVLQSLVSGLSGGGGGMGGLGDLLGALGGLFGVPQIMTFGDGGVSDRPAIFGERGPEAAVPLKHGRIPVEMRMPASGGGSTIRGGDVHITVAGDVSERNLEIIRREVERGQKQTLAAVNRAQAGQWRTG